MIIFSWNIQKITAKKARQFAIEFGRVVTETAGDVPFVIFVYENKTRPDDVLSALGTGITASGLACTWISTEGARGLRENILVICGNGATIDRPVPFTGWKAEFNERCGAMHEAEKQDVRREVARLAQRSTRPVTADARARRVDDVDRGTFRPANDFRSPLEITARCAGKHVRILALHAPGPSAGSEHEAPFARTYAESIFNNANGFDLIIGDFNLRTHAVRSNGFVDQGVRLGATTKGREEGRHTFSRLDRVYGRPGFGVSSALVSDGQERDLSDHHCLAVRIESREQKLIPDYFAYLPSPKRRQEVLYENRKRAFEMRMRGPKATPFVKGRERRRAEAFESSRQARLEAFAKNRSQPG